MLLLLLMMRRMQRIGWLWVMVMVMVVLGWRMRSAKGTTLGGGGQQQQQDQQGFMVFGTTLDAGIYKVTYEIIADEVAGMKAKRKSFTEEDLLVDLLTTGESLRESLPPSHSLLSHRRTKCQVRFTVRNVEDSSDSWDDAYPPDALKPFPDMTNPGRYIYSYTTYDLLAEQAANSAVGTAVHSAFWLLDITGIHCVQFDKTAKLVGGILTIKKWRVPLKYDSRSSSDLHTILPLIEGLMGHIKDHRAASDLGEKDSRYTVFVTTLAAVDDVVYKIVGEEPVGKRSNRKSFTEDFLPFHLLTKQEGASLPRSHSLFSHHKTTIEAKFFVRKVAKPADMPSQIPQVKDDTLRPKPVIKKLSPKLLPTKVPPLAQSLHPNFVARDETEPVDKSSPPVVLVPVRDTLDLSKIDQYMYSYSTFGLLPQYPPGIGGRRRSVHSSLWLLDGEGIHCFRYSGNEKFMGEMLTMAKWQFPLPTSPESPTDHNEILIQLVDLMKKVRQHRDEQDKEERQLHEGLLSVKT